MAAMTAGGGHKKKLRLKILLYIQSHHYCGPAIKYEYFSMIMRTLIYEALSRLGPPQKMGKNLDSQIRILV